MKPQKTLMGTTMAAALFVACSSAPGNHPGTGGSHATGGSSNGGPGGTSGSSGAGAGGSCASVTACGGNVVASWTVTSSCLSVSGQLDLSAFGIGCASAAVAGSLRVSGTWSARSDGSYSDQTTTAGTETLTLAPECLKFSGTTTTCDGISGPLQGLGYSAISCTPVASGGCTCLATVDQSGGMGVVSGAASSSGNWKTSANAITADDSTPYSYCVSGGTLTVSPQPASPTTTGTIVLQSGGNSSAGSGGAIGSGGAAGSSAATGGTAGRGPGGASGTGGSAGATGSAGSDGAPASMGPYQGPCDVYAAGNTPCAAAYSMARLLSSKYTGPLYQVRRGGSKAGSGGMTMDIGTVAGVFGDSATQDTFCGTSSCTVSRLYDQSGKGNDLTVAPAGCYVTTPDNESNAAAHAVTVNGHKVYSLYMVSKEGYRNDKAMGLPTGTASQGAYEIADGSRKPIDTGCCWDFGNARRDNCYTNGTGTMNTIYFGTGYWGKGAGTGPWFMGDFEAGIWSGGSGDSHATNNNDPSETMQFAFGTIKTSTTGNTPQYAIRVGDAQTGGLTTVYDGQAPHAWQMDGAVLLGIGGDNSNGGLGTFFEGAITSGRPSDATDLAVLQNAQAAGYGK